MKKRFDSKLEIYLTPLFVTFASDNPPSPLLSPQLLLGTKSVTMDTKVLSAVDGEKSHFLPKTLRINLAPVQTIFQSTNASQNLKISKKLLKL